MLGRNMDQANQTLVDNMCDMSGAGTGRDGVGHAVGEGASSVQAAGMAHLRVGVALRTGQAGLSMPASACPTIGNDAPFHLPPACWPHRLIHTLPSLAGLVDAVQALQQRNRLLQQDLDKLQGKHAELQRGHEAQARSLQAAQQQLAAAAEQQVALVSEHAKLQQEAAAARVSSCPSAKECGALCSPVLAASCLGRLCLRPLQQF